MPIVDAFSGMTERLGPKSPSGPTLLYFWSPSCSQCLIDAPALAQFARANPKLNVIGLGAGAAPRDSLELALLFPERTGIADDGSVTLVYDASYRSWQQFGVTSQPFWILYDRNGNPIASQPGTVDFDLAASAIS